MSNQKIFDNNLISNVKTIIKDKNFKNSLIFTSPGNVKREGSELIINILKQFNIPHKIFLVDGYPSPNSIYKAIQERNLSKIDLIISVGGGSVMDTAKIASACSAVEVNNSGIDNLISTNKIFHIAIPTTAGSGAESTKFATIWSKETNEKLSYENEKIIPEIVLLSPELTMTLPKNITLATSLDALCHCIDSLLNRYKNDESIDHGLQSIKLINKALPLLLNNLGNRGLRKDILKASNLAGKAINISKTSLNHAISYPITNLYNLEHGYACAFSVMSTIKMYENEITKLSYGSNLFESANLISTLKLEDNIRNKIKNLDVNKVLNLLVSNNRLSNFLFDIKNSDIKKILIDSKNHYCLY
tara:strand:- start:252 stop:1331 length:1080 start_codon:yes stop_codon:yes gene_type:complete